MRVCPYCNIFLPETETSCPRDGEQAIEIEPEAIPASLRERFEFVESFSRGGTGSAYLVDDTLTGRHGLLKVLRFGAGAYAAERMRIKRELAKQTSLSDAAVAQIIASGETPEESPSGKSLWLFREFVEGESLKLVLKRKGPLEVPGALAITAQIASGLDVLHRAGLLHRDLKPGHIIVRSHLSGVPRVTIFDVGIAVRIEANTLFDMMGTPSYLSPEQAAGRLVSFRSDLYSLGCVLYEMLVGAPPFTGDDVNTVLEAHRVTPAPVPEVELPEAVLALLGALLAKDPRERPFSAQQVRRTLDPLLPQAMPSGKPSAISTGAGRPSSIPPLRTAPGIPSPAKAPPADKEHRSVPPPAYPDSSSASSTGSRAPVPEALAREPVAEPEVEELGTGEFDVLMEIPSQAKALAESAAALEKGGPLADQRQGAASDQAEPVSDVTQQLDDADIQLAPDQPAGVTDTSPTRLISAEHLESVLEAAAEDRPESPIKKLAAALKREDAEQASEREDETTAFVKSEEQTEPPTQDYAQHPDLSPAGVAGAFDYDPDSGFGEGEARPDAEIPGPQSLDQDSAFQSPASEEERFSAWDIEYPDQKPVPDPFGTKAISMPIVKDKRIMVGVVGGLIVAAILFFFIGRDRSSEVTIEEAGGQEEPLQAGATAGPQERPSSPEAASAGSVESERASVKEPEREAEKPVEPSAAERAEPAAEEEERNEGKRRTARARRSRRTAAEPAKRERVPVIARTTAAPATAPAVAAKGGALERKEKADRLREEGRQHYAAGRYGAAAVAYREATRYAPSHAGAYAGLGASLLAAGDPDGAIGAYQRAIQLQPRSSGFHAALGRAYFTKGDGGRAVTAYRKALELNPNNKIARMALVRLGQQP
jgi:serine/threonine protein kinase/tetratricopeptide (TPR) repeat protein